MAEENYGIEEFEEAVVATVNLLNTIDETTQDGFQWTDLLSYIKPLAALPNAIEGAEMIPLELSDYSDEERMRINEKIKELKFNSEYSEKIGEQAVKTVSEICALLAVIREAKK